MPSFDRERGIAAQSAGAQAAVIVAALIQSGQNINTHEVFQTWRDFIFDGTMEKAMVPDGVAGVMHQNAAYPYPQPPQNAAPPFPQPASQPAPGPTPTCNHGLRVFKQGTSSKGPWRGWMCPQPKDAPDKCSAVFL